MTLDADVVTTRLAIMRELLDDLQTVGPVNADRLGSERLTRHAVERILVQLVDIAAAINAHAASATLGRAPSTYRDSFAAAAAAGLIPAELADRLAPSAGLRDALTHEYIDVSLDLVAAAVTDAIVDHSDYVEAVARTLRNA